MRLCISGSRDFVNLWKVEEVLKLLPRDTVIIHGAARGVDTAADRAAHKLGLAVEPHPADWSKHGRSAGMIRNREMLEGADKLIAFWNGMSPGTQGALQIAADLGIEALVIDDEAVRPQKTDDQERAVPREKPVRQ